MGKRVVVSSPAPLDPLGKEAIGIADQIRHIQNRMTDDFFEIGMKLRDVKARAGDDGFYKFVTQTMQNGWTIGVANHFIAKHEQFSSWTNKEWNKVGSAVRRRLCQVCIPNEAVAALQAKAASLIGTLRIIGLPTYDSIMDRFQNRKKRGLRNNFKANGDVKPKDKKLKKETREVKEFSNGIGGKVTMIFSFDRKKNLLWNSIEASLSGKVVARFEGDGGQVSLTAIRYCFSLL